MTFALIYHDVVTAGQREQIGFPGSLAARYKLEHVRELAAGEEGFTAAEWAQIAELGWPGLLIPEAYGGLGLGAVELVVIQTQGDRVQNRPLAQIGGDGLFTKAIQDALLEHRADIAVHSLKDLPTAAVERWGGNRPR